MDKVSSWIQIHSFTSFFSHYQFPNRNVLALESCYLLADASVVPSCFDKSIRNFNKRLEESQNYISKCILDKKV